MLNRVTHQPLKKMRVGTKAERRLDRSLRDWETLPDIDQAYSELREVQEAEKEVFN